METSEIGTPAERRAVWAQRKALSDAALGYVSADQVDAYARALGKSSAGQFKELEFALDDLKRAMPRWIRNLFRW